MGTATFFIGWLRWCEGREMARGAAVWGRKFKQRGAAAG